MVKKLRDVQLVLAFKVKVLHSMRIFPRGKFAVVNTYHVDKMLYITSKKYSLIINKIKIQKCFDFKV